MLEPVLLISLKEKERKNTKSVSGRIPQTTVFRSSHVHSWTWTVYGPSCLAFLPASVRPPSPEGCPCAQRQPLPSWPWYGPCWTRRTRGKWQESRSGSAIVGMTRWECLGSARLLLLNSSFFILYCILCSYFFVDVMCYMYVDWVNFSFIFAYDMII